MVQIGVFFNKILNGPRYKELRRRIWRIFLIESIFCLSTSFTHSYSHSCINLVFFNQFAIYVLCSRHWGCKNEQEKLLACKELII